MRAQIIKSFGDAKSFISAEIEKPTLQPGHVLVRVKGSSVNPIDCKIRSGAVPAVSPDLPAVIHGDVMGEVCEVASDVRMFKVGDEIYGLAGGVKGLGGALAEFMLVDARLIAKCSSRLTVRENAALPLVTITAWLALFDKLNLQAKQHILIHGGVGGVGHIAVQLAKWAGARIATTVSNDAQIEIAQRLGAHDVINFNKESVAEYVERLTDNTGFPLIFDTVGGNNLLNSFSAASLHGTIATTAARATLDLSLMHNKGLNLNVVFTLIPLLVNQQREKFGQILAQVTQLVDDGKLTPLVDPHAFKFSEVGAAHEWLESGKSQGKVVVEL